MRCFLTLILLVVAGAAKTDAHPGHTQLTEVEWNPVSERFEVAMKLDAAGLEDSLSVQTGKRFRLDMSEDIDKKLEKWMSKHFQITDRDSTRVGRVRWIGRELQRQTVWLYFEYLPARGGTLTRPADIAENDGIGGIDMSQLRLQNWCVLNVRPESVHYVILRDGKNVRYGHCSLDQPVLELTAQPYPVSGTQRSPVMIQGH
ncbi:MAG: hypothetical protein MK110_08960 [Fuerstiella sp.]|nr:hypothetical protein [Fuerstiella sp.]